MLIEDCLLVQMIDRGKRLEQIIKPTNFGRLDAHWAVFLILSHNLLPKNYIFNKIINLCQFGMGEGNLLVHSWCIDAVTFEASIGACISVSGFS